MYEKMRKNEKTGDLHALNLKNRIFFKKGIDKDFSL